MNVVKGKGQELEVTGARFPPQLCRCPAGRTWEGCFSSLGLSLSTCKAWCGTPGAMSYCLSALKGISGWKLTGNLKSQRRHGAETTCQCFNSHVDIQLHEGTLLASGLITIGKGHLSVTLEESSFQTLVLE